MAVQAAVQRDKRLYTVDEYHHMAEVGILKEDERVELIDGEVVKMSPIGTRHAACVKRLIALLTDHVGRNAIVGAQDPVRLSKYLEPQPDISLLKYRDDYYAQQMPGPEDVLLLIEVADTSLAYDRDLKVPLYAREGVPEVWVVDLNSDAVLVYRNPEEGAYTEAQTLKRGDTLPLPGVSGAVVEVEDILG
jgi:Uma2 family endonuclease